MTKTKRMSVILNFIKNKKIIADIGADHGILEYFIAKENIASKVIATDISEKSLEKTKNLAKKYHLETFIDCRVGDGLDILNFGEADLAIIAGIGGKEITKILSSKKRVDGIAEFILQPSKYSEKLREFLLNNGFFIKKDWCVFENGKFYDTMLVVYDNKKHRIIKKEIWFGKTNLKEYNEDFVLKLQKTKASLEKHANYISEDDSKKQKLVNELLSMGDRYYERNA